MEEDVYLFVYGSLMTGLAHHGQMLGSRYCGPAVLEEHHLVHYEGAYPALVVGLPEDRTRSSSGYRHVVGELFVVRREHLARLDAFEDCPQLYQRLEVRLSDGLAAEAYCISRERARNYPVIHGDFRRSGLAW